MTKDEFVKTACKMGYCNKQQAEAYCEGKEVFTDDDFIGVYRMVEAQRPRSHGHGCGNGFTSKRYKLDGNDNR